MNSGNAGGNAVLVAAGPEVFALTDEQILGMEPDEMAGEPLPLTGGAGNTPHVDGERETPNRETGTSASTRDAVSSAQAGVPVPQEPPGWLAERMRDPWIGDEARELWEGVQNAQREAAAYRELFARPEDARALKEIYPGGAAEAKAAAGRARELAEIDAVIFGAPGKSPQELQTGRAQLVEKLYTQDPAAFREMVEAGRQLLERSANGQPAASLVAQTPPTPPLVSHEVAARYREFESSANAELEKNVGGAINRAMQAALPNLQQMQGAGPGQGGHGVPLQERLAAAVREDVETALKNDAALGEQVARVLSGKRFDEASRAQVVRLIDARAQQLVPGAVRRVVGSWTTATLGMKKVEPVAEERKTVAAAHSAKDSRSPQPQERVTLQESSRKAARGRVDYRNWSDEQILDM